MVRFKNAWRNGAHAVVLEPLDFNIFFGSGATAWKSGADSLDDAGWEAWVLDTTWGSPNASPSGPLASPVFSWARRIQRLWATCRRRSSILRRTMIEDHFQLISRWYQQLDPLRTLDLSRPDSPDRALYIELDAWEYEGQRNQLRGPPAIPSMVRAIRLAGGSKVARSTHLFSGFRGTGKTTELSRVAELLRAHGFTVLRVSARKYHHLSAALSLEELAVLLAAGIGEAAMETLGEAQLPSLAKQGVWERIGGSLQRLFSESQVSLNFAGVQLKPALYRGEGLKTQLDRVLRDRPDKTREFLHSFVSDIAASVHPRQLVILVDDLEKYDVPTERVASVYTQMQELFFAGADLLKLPSCHVVYTVPPYVALLNRAIKEKYDGNLYLLPSVKVRERPPGHAAFVPGLAALEALIAQRVDLDALFGAERAQCMQRVIVASGGNLRDLFGVMRGPVQAALDIGLPVGLEQVEYSIQLHAAHFRLTQEPYELVRDVRRRGDLLGVDQSRQRGFADALDQRLLLCYWNGDFWYDAHPLIEAQLDAAEEKRR